MKILLRVLCPNLDSGANLAGDTEQALRPRLELYLISMLISAMAMSPTLRTGFPLSAPGDVAMVVAILYVGYSIKTIWPHIESFQ